MEDKEALGINDYDFIYYELNPEQDFLEEMVKIDNFLNEEMIGMTKEEYLNLPEEQKKQIRDFALFVKNQYEINNK